MLAMVYGLFTIMQVGFGMFALHAHFSILM